MPSTPIFDSQGRQVKVVSSSVRSGFSDRNSPLSVQAPGKTMLGKFAKFGGNTDIAKYKKLAADIESANPAIRSPLLNQSNFYMPESDSSTGEPNRLLNQWILYYYKWHPLCGNLINLHSELPLSRFALRGVEDPKILSFYESMVESAELHLKMVELLRQYFMFGEVTPFAFWSDSYNCFTDLTFLDPNYIYVKGHYLLHSDKGEDCEFYELEPDPLLVNLVKSDDQVNRMLREYLDESFVAAVSQNKRLLLSNFSTHMIRHKSRWSDLRGTAILLRCLKSLLYSDKLRESQYSIADGHINPKWIWKLGAQGDLATGGYMPSEEDLTAFRDLLIESSNDPIFTIITHYAVNVDAVGLNGKLLSLKQEYDQVKEDILVAMFSNEAVTTGLGPNFATASVAFRAMMSRYVPIRAKVERYLYHKIFAPVAYANKFYKRKQADIAHRVRTGDEDSNELIIPQIDWRSKSNLLDDGTAKSIISSAVNSGRLPMKILTEALDLDYEEVRNYLYREQGSVFDPVARKARETMGTKVEDETMLGQPFLPKHNNPVSLKSQTGKNAEPHAKKSASLSRKLLSVRPLTAADPVKKDPIQTEIDKGKPEKGGNPEVQDPMAKALEIKLSTKEDTGPVSKVFDVDGSDINRSLIRKSVVKKSYNSRKLSNKKCLVNKPKEKTDAKT